MTSGLQEAARQVDRLLDDIVIDDGFAPEERAAITTAVERIRERHPDLLDGATPFLWR